MDKLGDLNKLAKDKLGVDLSNTKNIGQEVKDGYSKYLKMSSDDKSAFNKEVTDDLNSLRGGSSEKK